MIYLSEGAEGGNRSYVGNATRGISEMAVAPDTTLWPFSHVVAFTRSALTEQTTLVSFTVVDAFANVSNVTFVDKDLDFGP